MISLIVPCWKDHDAALAFAETWAPHPLIREIIIAGVQNDLRPKDFNGKIKRCVADRPGRGLQMNLGAQLATGEVLLFHHVDSILTEAHLQSLANAMYDRNCVGGAFYRKFDERHPHLRWLENCERWHGRAFGTLYGDQSVFVRSAHFNGIGGFASIPLMEDVEFSRRLRRSGKVKLLDPPMGSCPCQQIKQGTWRVTIRNLLFLILFRGGVKAQRLHRWYYARTSRAEPMVSGPPSQRRPLISGRYESRRPGAIRRCYQDTDWFCCNGARARLDHSTPNCNPCK